LPNTIVQVTGVTGYGMVGTVNVWGQIVNPQDPNWTPINDGQTSGWTDINNVQTANWTQIAA
jgi:hypothetical protein